MIGCFIIDAGTEIDLNSRLGIRLIPSFVFFKRSQNTTHLRACVNRVTSVKSIADLWAKQSPADIHNIVTDKHLQSFLRIAI